MYLIANAKINIVLNVLRKRKDGYHELDGVMIPLKLHDTIATNRIFSKKKDNIVLFNDLPKEMPNNICLNVIKFMCNKYNITKKYEFSIYKDIPMESGLGGGSSDAAAIFNFYKKKFKLNISNEEAINDLKQFGADIPFFIINKPARVQGLGEIINPINIKNNYYVLVVKPKDGLSTKEVFKLLDEMQIKTYNVDETIRALETGDDELLAKSIGNSLEEPAIKKCFKVKEIKDYLIKNGLPITLMSGSGSAVFSLSTNKDLIAKLANDLKVKNYNVFRTEIIK